MQPEPDEVAFAVNVAIWLIWPATPLFVYCIHNVPVNAVPIALEEIGHWNTMLLSWPCTTLVDAGTNADGTVAEAVHAVPVMVIDVPRASPKVMRTSPFVFICGFEHRKPDCAMHAVGKALPPPKTFD